MLADLDRLAVLDPDRLQPATAPTTTPTAEEKLPAEVTTPEEAKAAPQTTQGILQNMLSVEPGERLGGIKLAMVARIPPDQRTPEQQAALDRAASEDEAARARGRGEQALSVSKTEYAGAPDEETARAWQAIDTARANAADLRASGQDEEAD